MSHKEEIAWAAGLFEGEGCFFTHERKDNGQTMVGASLSTTDRDVLERFAKIVGVGRVRGPITSKDWKPQWHWRVQDAAGTVAVIELLRPWLGERRLQKATEVEAATARIGVAPANRRFCPNGHEYTAPNTMIVKTKDGGYRKCRTCWNRYKRELAARKRTGERVANLVD